MSAPSRTACRDSSRSKKFIAKFNIMKSSTPLKRGALLLAFCAALMSPARAQYCQPSFVNGCFNWGTQAVSFGSLNWSLGSSLCTDFDYTSMQANLTTGVPHLMSVDNNDWCGCAVWIDYNQDSVFDASENVFYSYQANQMNTYTIYITIPNGTAVGMYRMRIISPWGSDGFLSTNVNGYGPCGAYQYGSFQDFTVNVTGPQGIDELGGKDGSYMAASLNRENNQVNVSLHDPQPANVTLLLTDITGREVARQQVSGTNAVIDVSGLPSGIYVLNYFDGTHRQSIKLVK
jgi:hypothetical protein